MKNKLFVQRFIAAITLSLVMCTNAPVVSASNQPQTQAERISHVYNTGNPTLTDIWVDAVNGNDSNNGATPATAFRTLTAAWNSIPTTNPLSQGRRINLQPGTYTESMIPNYWEDRYGTFDAPIFIRGNGSSRGDVVLQGTVNMYNVHYAYFENLSIVFNGDNFHCELCDHILLRNMVMNAGAQQAQETIKINQSQYIYIENSDISGAYDNAIDFVAVQYGHILNNRIHNAGDWCAYAKGGSAYLRVEANIIYDCGTGGFTAGQGTGFQFMSPPWIQYEAYDIKVVNNVIHDTEGAGLGVNGGYDILMAYNTMYRVGSRDHVIEVVFGMRSCDGQPGDPGRERCQQYLNQGGWGTTVVDNGSNAVNIPNRNVFIYNNIVYNPAGYQSLWQHFAIYDSRANPAGTNAPNPARTDTNLNIRGNVIWNGGAGMPLGIEGNSDACIASNPTCNETQLRADNAINTVEPLLVNPSAGDFHINGAWASSINTYAIPDFVWDIGSVPAGNNSNAIPVDFNGIARVSTNPPGAFYGSGASTIFSDISADYWAWPWIERLYNAGITGGCNSSPLMYCPEASVTRAQMAIFILRGMHGSAYVPPTATGAVFGDVPAGAFAADWIEQLAAEGVTAGCGGGNYCPDASITRAQMAIFLLRGEHGSTYTPPPATGTVFSDVPLGSFADAWIEQLADEGVTSGCGGGNYCPNANVTRAEMAVFLVRVFGLP
ncbi:MAG: S-layer homology domain-containing protein [Chloroflexi bacterium]|nr:S-layer homology domain-containing protein [Chloroflexota bacterium]